MKILDKAKEFGQALTETPEYIRLKEAEKVHFADEESLKAMEAYNNRRKELANEFRREDLTEEELESLRKQMADELLKLTDNVIVREFLESSRAFGEMMAQINAIIGHFVKGDSEGCEGSCGSCSGCN